MAELTKSGGLKAQKYRQAHLSLNRSDDAHDRAKDTGGRTGLGAVGEVREYCP